MELAKNSIDIGLQTNQLDAMLDFWGNTVGLPYEELLKVGGGTHQHRHTLNGSVFKLNHVRDTLKDYSPTGYSGLLIADANLVKEKTLTDPDGNSITMVPQGMSGISHIGINMEVSSLDEFRHFYRNILQIEEINDTCFKWSSTLLFLNENTNHPPCEDMRGVGFRYITVQVHKVDEEHRGVLARGAGEGFAPVTLGSTARISFIRDPDGNWIEISQRASLTGDLTVS